MFIRLVVLAGLLLQGLAIAQHVAFNDRDIVSNPFESFVVKVALDRDASGASRPLYRVGEAITISVETQQDAFVYLFSVHADGIVTLLLPNAIDQDNFNLAGITRHVPGSEYGLTITGPEGLDKVLVVASKRALRLDRLFNASEGSQYADAVLNQWVFANALAELLAYIPSSDWSASTVELYVGEAADDNHPTYATLEVGSTPAGAEVYVDGRFQGYTPLALSTTPGVHDLLVEIEGFEHLAAVGLQRAAVVVQMNAGHDRDKAVGDA